MTSPIVALAGAGGDLGSRIAKALVARGATVRALLRPDATAEDEARAMALGAEIVRVDAMSEEFVASALQGVDVVVSALNGLRDTIIGRQRVLLDAAVKADVPRFISSDYSEDFTKTTPGRNRNLDLRREFMEIADRAPIKVTSILNGAFMDMLGAEMPIIQRGIRRVLYWRSADQPLDFTTKDDVAIFTAMAAKDEQTPRILRISGDTLTVREIADVMSAITSERYRPLWAGNIASLGLMIRAAKLIAPQPEAVFPAWQGMQYMRDMFSGEGKLDPLNNNRYPRLRWTSVRNHLTSLRASGA